jgi:hypothetical protein
VDRKRSSLLVEFLEEATHISGVASAPSLLDLEEKHVPVTICEPATDFLFVAAGFSLEPEFLSRAAPIVHKAGFQGLLEGFAIHPREH